MINQEEYNIHSKTDSAIIFKRLTDDLKTGK